MNGVHDMGGMHGFGPVVPEPNEPVFHADWERRVFGLLLALGAWHRWNLDMSRFVKEQMPPAEYLASSYYEKHLYGLERLLIEKGVVTSGEMQHGASERRELLPGALRPENVTRALMSRRGTARLEDPVEPRFQVGQQVRARNCNPVGHTRLPRYVRGRHGTIDRDHGVFIFPDTHAVNGDTAPQHVYSVRFSAQELWGPEARAHESVYVDLWDDYLDPTTTT
jgi:nitrile hydratase